MTSLTHPFVAQMLWMLGLVVIEVGIVWVTYVFLTRVHSTSMAVERVIVVLVAVLMAYVALKWYDLC